MRSLRWFHSPRASAYCHHSECGYLAQLICFEALNHHFSSFLQRNVCYQFGATTPSSEHSEFHSYRTKPCLWPAKTHGHQDDSQLYSASSIAAITCSRRGIALCLSNQLQCLLVFSWNSASFFCQISHFDLNYYYLSLHQNQSLHQHHPYWYQ